MKEFLFESKIIDLSEGMDLIRDDICAEVLNAELGTNYNNQGFPLSSYPSLQGMNSINIEKMEHYEAKELKDALDKL